MKVILCCLLLVATVAPSCSTRRQRRAEVSTPRGTILGSTFTSLLGKTIYGFRGIRYAKAPVGELRFQPPQPPEEWQGHYNATEDAPSCPQVAFKPNSEDCLFLNVYTTKLPRGSHNPKRPVIVHLHPGAFVTITGRSDWAGPQYLLDQDVVLVTLNYRLGALGYISTGTKEAPGNFGMKDQVLAMKWVKQNIIHFGGDPDCVTIYGYSAGSVSVMLHMMSPMARGLFHRAISGSVSALGTWPNKTNQLDLAKRQARVVGCPDDTPANIINCLKTIPADVLANSLDDLYEFGWGVLEYEPVVEPDFGQERYLTDFPVHLALRGEFENVPFMAGITKDEFGYAGLGIVNNDTLLEILNQNFDKLAPLIFTYERDTERSLTISHTLRKKFLGDGPIDKSSLRGLTVLYEDGISGFGINRAVKLFSAKSRRPVYYYRFSFQGRYSFYYRPGTNNTVPYGVVHHDDLIYLFYISLVFPLFTTSDPEYEMVDKLTTMWANFARTGHPVPQPSAKLDNVRWEPFTTQNGKYMDIGNRLTVKTGLHEDRYRVWEELFPLPHIS